MSRGNFIVLEGGDAAGKKTQTHLLLEHLSSRTVKKFDFPRYERIIGRNIGRALKGDFGDFLHLHPMLASMLYTLDRVAAKASLELALTQGDVICNRYTPSNVAYQAAKLEGEAREVFIRELEDIEYKELGLPRPTQVLYLDVPPDFSAELLRERGPKDQHEADIDYQRRVASVYHELALSRADWVIISCVEEGNLLSPAVIHERVWAQVASLFY